jgi:hypothetical protein
MLATPPENDDAQQWVHYSVAADGQTLAKGETGTWVLGAVNIDVPLSGEKQLSLEVSTEGAKKKTLFWVNPRFAAGDTELPSEKPIDVSNVEQPEIAGRDYYGGPIRVAGMVPATAWPTQPTNPKVTAVIHIGIPPGAKRFLGTIGGDWQLGDDRQRRKIFASRVCGTEAFFLTVIEPYEDQPKVKSAVATAPDVVRAELTDGRIQEIHIHHLDGDARDISVDINEMSDGKTVRGETTGMH